MSTVALAHARVTAREQAGARIRLVKFVTLFGCGGTERQFVNLGLALDPARFDLRFACIRRWGAFLEDIAARGIGIDEYRIDSFMSTRAAVQHWRLARALRRDRVQIVHGYNFYGLMFAVLAGRLAQTPVVIASIRDRGVYLTPAQLRVQRMVAAMADCVLVNADSIRSWLIEQGYDERRIAVIPNGVDLTPFDQVTRDGAIRQELGIPAGVPIVGMIARLSPTKGFEEFIDAAAVVRTRHPEARFLAVGDGLVARDGVLGDNAEYRGRLQARIDRLGLGDRFLLTGFRADVASVLGELAVSVLPSHNEGLSNVILESMASGLPVVATRVGGTPEAVSDGVTGYLVPPADARALADAISALLTRPEHAAAMGRAGRQIVRDRFSVARMVDATSRLYVELLARRRRP